MDTNTFPSSFNLLKTINFLVSAIKKVNNINYSVTMPSGKYIIVEPKNISLSKAEGKNV